MSSSEEWIHQQVICVRESHREFGERRSMVARHSLEANSVIVGGELPLYAVYNLLLHPSEDFPDMLYPKAHYSLHFSETIRNMIRASDGGEEAFRNEMMAPADDCASLDDLVRKNLYFCSIPGMHLVYGAVICRYISYINHSCTPNAMLTFGAQQSGFIVALRPIEAGEEVTIAYTEFGENDCAANRGEEEKTLNFRCKCITCKNYDQSKAFDIKVTVKADDMEDRVFFMILNRLRETPLTAWKEHFRLGYTLFKRKNAWKRFVNDEKMQPVLVGMGLEMCAAAVCAETYESPRVVELWNEWARIFGSIPPNKGLSGQEYGVKLFFIIYKFMRFRVMHTVPKKNGVGGQTERVKFQHLTQSKQRSMIEEFTHSINSYFSVGNKTYYVGHQRSWIIGQLHFHLYLLGCVPVWDFIYKFFIEKMAEENNTTTTTSGGTEPLVLLAN